MREMSRKQYEGIVVGDNISVTVVEICDDSVSLSIEFPPEMPLERREAYEARLREEEWDAVLACG